MNSKYNRYLTTKVVWFAVQFPQVLNRNYQKCYLAKTFFIKTSVVLFKSYNMKTSGKILNTNMPKQ